MKQKKKKINTSKYILAVRKKWIVSIRIKFLLVEILVEAIYTYFEDNTLCEK